MAKADMEIVISVDDKKLKKVLKAMKEELKIEVERVISKHLKSNFQSCITTEAKLLSSPSSKK